MEIGLRITKATSLNEAGLSILTSTAGCGAWMKRHMLARKFIPNTWEKL